MSLDDKNQDLLTFSCWRLATVSIWRNTDIRTHCHLTELRNTVNWLNCILTCCLYLQQFIEISMLDPNKWKILEWDETNKQTSNFRSLYVFSQTLGKLGQLKYVVTESSSDHPAVWVEHMVSPYNCWQLTFLLNLQSLLQ